MMNKKKICVILVVFSILCGCTNDKSASLEVSEYNNTENIITKEQFVEDKTHSGLCGVVCANEDLFVVSKGDNCVIQYTNSGDIKNTFGIVGNGEGEFSSPVAICEFDNMIYIADENDGRVQVFDLDGNCLKKYYIDEINDSDISVLDVEVDEKYLYISVASFNRNRAKIYMIDKVTGEYKKIGKDNMGVFGRDNNNNIYFAQAFDYFKDGDNDGYQDGDSYICTISDGKLVKLFELPEKYSPSDLFVFDDQLYIFSRAYSQIDVFELNGTYIKTIFSESSTVSNRGLGYMDIDKNGIVYLSDRENSIIYKLEKEK